MRKIILILCLLGLIGTGSVKAQEGFQLGLELSPAWNINVQKQLGTGLRTYASGYGFNVGVPVKWWAFESLALQTGLSFEYMAFDNRFQNTLVSSLRYGSLHLPLMFNYAVTDGWYAIFGGGVNYNVFNQSWVSGIGINISNQTNKLQPYVGAGVSTMMHRDKGSFELGAQARFHLINIWADGTVNAMDFKNKILSFDLILRYYLFNR